MRELTAAERVVFGKLVFRQLTRVPATAKALRRYGVSGATQLCGARAAQVYMFLIAVPMVAFAVAGRGYVALPLFGAMLVLFALCVIRLAVAARAGRRWRSSPEYQG
jgi:hypothetical protein